MGNIIGRGPEGRGSVGDGMGRKIWDMVSGSMNGGIGIQLITACFVAIELFTCNKKAAEQFFLRLTEAMVPDAYLLVLDSSHPRYSIINGEDIWTCLDKLIIRDNIPCDSGNDKMVLKKSKNEGRFDGNEYLNDGTYSITRCDYTYRLYKKERI